jgi:hypothetical protein
VTFATHMGKVMEQLGIADAMTKKVIFKPALERQP